MMDSCEMIQNWIFEHGCRNEMFKLIAYFFEEENWGENGQLHSSCNTEAHQYALCLAYLRCIVNIGPHRPQEVYGNPAILESLIKIIPSVIRKKQFFPFTKCLKMMKWIKTLYLLVSLHSGEDIITDKVKLHFPNNLEEYVKSEYNLENYCRITKLSEDYKFLRRYIYVICSTPESLNKYLNSKYHVDYEYISTKIQKLLKDFVNAMAAKSPISPLDQVLSATQEISGFGNAAFELLIEHYKPKMSEEEILEMVKLFFPQNYSPLLLQQQSYQSLLETQELSSNSKVSDPMVEIERLQLTPSELNSYVETSENKENQSNECNTATSSSDHLIGSKSLNCSSTPSSDHLTELSSLNISSKELLSKCRKARVSLRRMDSSAIRRSSSIPMKTIRKLKNKSQAHSDLSATLVSISKCQVYLTKSMVFKVGAMQYDIYI